MKAILLCAGFGTRLRPLTNHTPKCLLPLAGKPLIDYWLDQLLGRGLVEEVLVNVHYLAEQFYEHLEQSPYRQKIRIVHEDKVRGTAGTLINNFDFYENEADMLLIHGDNFYTGNLSKLIDAHACRPIDCDLTMLIFEAERPEQCGVVMLDNRNVVIKFFEKHINPPGNLSNAAIYVLSSSLLSDLQKNKEITDFSLQVLPNLMGRIYTTPACGKVIDIGTIESYAKAQAVACASPQI